MGATASISHDLIALVREVFHLGVHSLAENRRWRVGNNGFSERALAAYVIAVAAIEAFVNEAFFAEGHRPMLERTPLLQLRQDWLEKLDLRDKIVLLSQLLFERQLSRGAQPLQSLETLVRIRNEVVHYKMAFREPKFVAELRGEGIALPATPPPPGLEPAEGPWAHVVATTEGIRWANNVAVGVVTALADLAPANETDFRERRLDRFASFNQYAFVGDIARSLASNFALITEAERDHAFEAIDASPHAV